MPARTNLQISSPPSIIHLGDFWLYHNPRDEASRASLKIPKDAKAGASVSLFVGRDVKRVEGAVRREGFSARGATGPTAPVPRGSKSSPSGSLNRPHLSLNLPKFTLSLSLSPHLFPYLNAISLDLSFSTCDKQIARRKIKLGGFSFSWSGGAIAELLLPWRS